MRVPLKLHFSAQSIKLWHLNTKLFCYLNEVHLQLPFGRMIPRMSGLIPYILPKNGNLIWWRINCFHVHGFSHLTFNMAWKRSGGMVKRCGLHTLEAYLSWGRCRLLPSRNCILWRKLCLWGAWAQSSGCCKQAKITFCFTQISFCRFRETPRCTCWRVSF